MLLCKESLLCLLMALCLPFHGALADDNRCPGGYAEGTTIDIGAYWYECRSGRVIPKGCLTDDRMRVEIQETYDSKSFRMQCVLDSAGQLSLIYKACVQNGREYRVGESWDDGRSRFACKQSSNYLRVETTGCVDGGRQVSLGEKVARDRIVYQCKKNSEGVPTLFPWGCASGGSQYAVGEKFDYDGSVYECTGNADKVYTKCIGCLNGQQRLSAGDLVYRDDVIYECVVEDEKTRLEPSGCIQRESGGKIDRKLDCFWIEGQPPFQYQMTCKHDKASHTAVKQAVKCVYKVTQGSYVVEPGCYAVADRTGVGCLRDSSNGLTLRTFQVDENGYGNAPGGLTKC